MTRLRLGVITLLAIATALVAGTFAWRHWSRPAPDEPLVIAIAISTFSTPLWVAQRQGFFAAEGLEVTLRGYPTGKLAMEAMLRGEAEVATVAETPLMFAGFKGTPVRVIANLSSSSEHAVIARADRGIRTPADLVGRRIGVSLGTTGHSFLHAVLTDQGLSDADVAVVDLPVLEQAAALVAGQVDAVATFAPYMTQCQQALGAQGRTFLSGIRYTGYTSLVVAPDLIHRRAEVIVRLLRATDRAINWMRAHPEAAQAIGAEASGTDIKSVRASWASLRPNLALDQGFMVLLNAQARWAIAAGLVPADASAPDYRALIEAAPLAKLRPDAVTLIQQP